MNALLRHPEKWTKRESNISPSPVSGKAQDCDQIGPFLCCQTFLSRRTNSNRFADWSAHRRHHILDRRGRSWLVRQHLVCLHLHCRTAGRARLASALLLRGGDLQGRESAGQSSGVRGRDRLGDSRSFGTLGDDTSFIYGLSAHHRFSGLCRPETRAARADAGRTRWREHRDERVQTQLNFTVV